MADFFGNVRCEKCDTVHAATDKCYLIEAVVVDNTRHQIKDVAYAKHDDSSKPPLAQLSRHALIEVANILLWGASKYDVNNWRKGMEWSRLVNSVLRHMYAWNEGQDLDEESGLNHLSHAMCDIMFLIEYQLTHPELDDRIKNVVKKTN